MPTTFSFVRRAPASSIVFLFALVSSASAAPSSDTLLPKSTKGYVSVAHAKEFDERWNKTQIGQMFADDVMKTFVDDFKKQIREDFGAVERKLGLTYDDLKGVTAGEVSLSLIERKGHEASLAVTIDVADNAKKADVVLAAIEKRFAARKGTKSSAKAGDTTLHVFSIPAQGEAKAQTTVYFTKDNVLVGIDDRAEAESILKRFAGNATDNLKSVKAYQMTMAKCASEAGKLQPEARWFIDPFGFIFADRTLHSEPSKREQDIAKILYDNGFSAIQGAGGYLNQLVEGHIELLARSAVYAPAVAGKENDPLRWTNSMRMMQLPNAPAAEPQSWAPRELASYVTLNMKLTDAFDNVGPLVDAIQDHEDAWKNTLDGWKNDPYGQQVDVRKEFIQNMGNRVTVISSYDTPVTEESERAIFAIEAKDEKALAKTLEKWMAKEDVVKHQVGQYVIYERTPKDLSEPAIDVPKGFSEERTGNDEKSMNEKKRSERVLPNAAVTVALGHLMKASDIKYLTEILEGFGQRERLGSSADYKQMEEVMSKVAPGERSGYHFGRSDEEVRPTFDMIRQGKMPQSKSMLGKLLNKVLTTEDEKKQGVPRRQRINGASLPEFETVRRYFGPHGAVVRSDKDGWFVTSVLLNKEAP